MDGLSCGYVAVGLLWSAYQGGRGVVETRLANTGRPGVAAENWKPWERLVVLYIHDFAFRFVCTAAGFVALCAAYVTLGPDKSHLLAAPASALAFASFAFLVGVIGVGGQLHYVILFGKWPKV
jgi:hypothetical protein